MTQIFAILLIGVVLARDSASGLALPFWAAIPAWAVIAVACGGPLLIALANWVAVRTCLRRLDRGRGPRLILLVDRFVHLSGWLALAVHAAAVMVFGWMDLVRSALGNLVLVDELVVVAPPLACLAAVWWAYYPLDRRLREASLIRRLDRDEPIYPIPSRGRFVVQQFRVHLLLILVPVLLIYGWSETTRSVVAPMIGRSPDALAIDAMAFAGGVVIFLVAPVFAGVILDARPLPDGPLRLDLLGMCRRHRVRVRELLLWHTDGSMINGAVMGLIGRLRYVLLTDALVNALTRRQIQAVMAHEIGHVRRHHMGWLAATLVATIAGASVLVELPLRYAQQTELGELLPAESLDPVIVLATLAATLVIFGWICRRFERQADTFAVQHLTAETRRDEDQEGAVVATTEAAEAMRSALLAVARLNGIDPERRSWRHGSIDWRCRYLVSLIGTPIARMRIDREIRLIKAGAVVVILLAGAWTVWAVVTSPSPRAAATRYDSPMRFTKMHGIGNDYVYLDAVTEPGLLEVDLPALARTMADRHSGVGGDGLIVICAPDTSLDLPAGRAVRMRMFNADGSESEMCGNGVRCVAKYAFDHGLVHADDEHILVQTGAGVLDIACTREDGRVVSARVDMGPPELEPSRVPVRVASLEAAPSVANTHRIPGPDAFDATFVSLGNPHAVIFVDDVAAVDLERIGPRLEHHDAFPNRMNIHFVEVDGPGEITMRTWERGSGITLACGTGASAVCVAGALTGRTARAILAHLAGGDLDLHWDEASGHVFMTGSATEVFQGEWLCGARPPVETPA